ncbi:MFS transporter [Maridesulfovibrio sp. FT414]|uniref:MFS transporter n=1 Tax=Maridesulfovibrio sp. FT414 TaxID=2979469 RepID=UPI003D808610
MTTQSKGLPVFEFLILCSVVFLAVCNNSVYYSLHVYLQGLGFSKSASGFIISIYSLAGMFMYAAVSSFISIYNAYRFMSAGMLLVVLGGSGYLFVNDFWLLCLLRVGQGVGMFMTLAPCVALLVSMISTDNAGSAFSLYSTALLLPYSLLPDISERLVPHLGGSAMMYAATASLIPVAFMMTLFLRWRTARMHLREEKAKTGPSLRESYSNVARLSIMTVLAANGIYFMIFTGVFFLFQDFAHSRGIERAGYFFSVQMGVMIALRLFGGTVFDRFSKRGLIVAAFLINAVGFLMLMGLSDEAMLLPIAAVFGIGMGLSAPALNSLMFTVSEPRFRSFNVNMMMFTVHMGSFLGPLLGGVMVDMFGYGGFLQMAAIGTGVAALVFLFMSRGGLQVETH